MAEYFPNFFFLFSDTSIYTYNTQTFPLKIEIERESSVSSILFILFYFLFKNCKYNFF